MLLATGIASLLFGRNTIYGHVAITTLYIRVVLPANDLIMQ